MSEDALRAGGGAELADITELYRRNPTLAVRRFGETWGEWWRSREEETELRDYYSVEDTDGRRFWLYRSGLHQPGVMPRWFLHGVFP